MKHNQPKQLSKKLPEIEMPELIITGTFISEAKDKSKDSQEISEGDQNYKLTTLVPTDGGDPVLSEPEVPMDGPDSFELK